MATTSDDPAQPMLFRSPGLKPPTGWDPARQAGLQRPRFHTLAVTLRGPGNPQLSMLCAHGVLAWEEAPDWEMVLRFGDTEVSLP